MRHDPDRFLQLLERSWAAGFFDGEGNVCFSHTGDRSPRIMAQVAQVELKPLEDFHRIVGVGQINGPYTPRSEQSRPYYRWVAGSLDDVTITHHVLVNFLRLKNSQFVDALWNFNQWRENATCKNGHDMKDDARGRLYCPTCKSIAGLVGSRVRWS